MCVVLLDTGCHPSNVYDVRDEGDVASWTRVKKNYTCWASMTDRLSEAIRTVHTRPRLSRQATYNKVTEAAYRARIEAEGPRWTTFKDVSPQTLRKSYCLNLLLEGEHPSIVAMMMGCGQRLVDTVYSQLSPADRRAIAMERGV